MRLRLIDLDDNKIESFIKEYPRADENFISGMKTALAFIERLHFESTKEELRKGMELAYFSGIKTRLPYQTIEQLKESYQGDFDKKFEGYFKENVK